MKRAYVGYIHQLAISIPNFGKDSTTDSHAQRRVPPRVVNLSFDESEPVISSMGSRAPQDVTL